MSKKSSFTPFKRIRFDEPAQVKVKVEPPEGHGGNSAVKAEIELLKNQGCFATSRCKMGSVLGLGALIRCVKNQML